MPMEILPEIWKRTFLANTQLTIRKQQAEIWRHAAFNRITMVSFLFNNRQFLKIFLLKRIPTHNFLPSLELVLQHLSTSCDSNGMQVCSYNDILLTSCYLHNAYTHHWSHQLCYAHQLCSWQTSQIDHFIEQWFEHWLNSMQH